MGSYLFIRCYDLASVFKTREDGQGFSMCKSDASLFEFELNLNLALFSIAQ